MWWSLSATSSPEECSQRQESTKDSHKYSNLIEFHEKTRNPKTIATTKTNGKKHNLLRFKETIRQLMNDFLMLNLFYVHQFLYYDSITEDFN